MTNLKEPQEVWTISYELLPGIIEHATEGFYSINFYGTGMRYYKKDRVFKTKHEALKTLIKTLEEQLL